MNRSRHPHKYHSHIFTLNHFLFLSSVQVSMMAKELLYSDQEAGNEESTLLQDPYEEEEEEEALSLCDLPIYSGSTSSSQWSDSSKEDGKSSRSNSKDNDYDDDDDFFEFFSEELTTSTHSTADNNIIFCGKLIPFKDHPHKGKNLQSNNIQKKGEEQEAKVSKSFACDYKSMEKVSLVRCTTKSRWFLFMFGMSKLSTTNEMQLRDIRDRQSRRAPATMFPAPEEHGKEVTVKGRRNFKRMWQKLRSISMVFGRRRSKLANDVVKAAFV